MRRLLLLALMCSSPAVGCEIDTPTAWLPGFSKEQVDNRQGDILRAWSNIRRHERTEALVSSAPIIYLARVTKAQHDEKYLRFVVSLDALKSIKGKMPANRQLEGTAPSSCGDAHGDGDGAYAKAGELVVVFEGVPKTDNQARGIDSVRMIEVLSGSLLDPVQEWLSEQRDYRPYD